MLGLRATLGFLRREVADLARQRTLLLLTVLGPFLILLAFGAGYRDERLVLRTRFVGPEGRGYEELLDQHADRFDEFIDDRGYTDDLRAARAQLERGDVDAVVVFPADPLADVLAGQRAVVEVIHDELNPIQQVAVEFAVRIATDEVNQAVVEGLLAVAREEAQPYARTVQALDERRRQLGRGGDVGPVLEDLEATLAGLQAQSGALDRFWSLYGQARGRDELAALRGELDVAAQLVEELQQGGGTVSQADLDRLDASIDALVRASRLVERVDPAVLARPFRSTTSTLSSVDVDELDFFGAAAAALLLQHLALSLGALTFVRDRSLGLFELLRVGPAGAGAALVGKVLAFALVGGAVAGALLAALHLLLGVPLVGDVRWLAVVVGLLLLASIGMGASLSLLARSDTQAVQYAMLVLLASLFFSGFFLDHERFRLAVSAAARLLPVTSAISAAQDVALRGRVPSVLDVAVLAALAVGSFSLAWWLLRRELRTA